MQPTLVLSAPHPGILYINGRFAGEISRDFPLIRPVSSRGAVYLDYRPLSENCACMARKLVFSNGEPLQQSVEEAGNLSVVCWCGGTTEIELTPAEKSAPAQRFSHAGYEFTLENGHLHRSGRRLCALPEGAGIPDFREINGCRLLTGSCKSGRYLLMLGNEAEHPLGFLQAQQLEIEPDGRIRALVSREDLAGHATLETWRITPEGLELAGSEHVWAQGSPRWPRTPAETARAAVEAMLAGLHGEAEGYLSPALRSHIRPGEILENCDLCVEMKYAPPDPRPCVGLLKLQGDRLARVQPLYYRASPSGGLQGPWQIDALESE